MWLVILVIAILLVFSVWQLSKFKEKKPEECQTDNDCVKVLTTCCPCNMGGKEACVNKLGAENYIKSLENCPKDIFCAAVYNCKLEKCRCVGGKCQEKE